MELVVVASLSNQGSQFLRGLGTLALEDQALWKVGSCVIVVLLLLLKEWGKTLLRL